MTTLSVAWRLCGPQADGWVTERFWAETQREQYWACGLTQWVDVLTSEGATDARRKLSVLLREPAFEDCDWILLEHIARRIDAWTEPDVIGEDELRRAYHPLGAGALATAAGRARAAAQHPEQTRVPLELLAAWRARILESIPRWERAGR